MRRPLAILLVLLVAAPFAFSSPAAGGGGPTIEMRIATTKTKLKAFGQVENLDRKRILVTLHHYIEGNDVVSLTTKRPRLAEDGSFLTSFERPDEGECWIEASYRKGRGNEQLDWDELDCARPEWATGTATLQMGTESKEITVEIADDNPERQYGLMYRKHLGVEKGMAFQFTSDSQGGFWMRNCLIPLSIAFYDAAGQIVSILDMQPCSEADSETGQGCQSYDSGETYRGALEVNLGAFEEWGVEVGDFVLVSETP